GGAAGTNAGAGAPGAGAGGGGQAVESVLDEADLRLFEALKAWRLQAAGGKPAYTVANNATLALIAQQRPGSDDALSQIRGVGPTFLDRHADSVLELVAAA
ncbi:MAG TPA: HRDC domain-containing protein, partial [Solirubrobacterales bacterium]|nr:HRDC domain-containing protein [Solirubrobacterales bacterium]